MLSYGLRLLYWGDVYETFIFHGHLRSKGWSCLLGGMGIYRMVQFTASYIGLLECNWRMNPHLNRYKWSYVQYIPYKWPKIFMGNWGESSPYL